LDENELKILSEISKNSGSSQRELSSILNLSLGMVNIMLHRLVEKGFMKIHHMDGRSVKYILTQKGIFEKTTKAKQYLQKTIDTMTIMKEAVKDKMRAMSKEGKNEFYVYGDWSFTHIVDLAVKELGSVEGFHVSCKHIKNLSEIKGGNAVILGAGEKKDEVANTGHIFIDIIELLSEKVL
jgi:DNA-binding MarR family transcriptional regulator